MNHAKRVWMVTAISAAVVALVLAATFALVRLVEARNAAELSAAKASFDKDIQESISASSTSLDIQNFLRTKQVGYQFYNQLDPYSSEHNDGAVEMIDGSKPLNSTLSRCKLHFVFYLDDAGKLLKFNDKIMCTGPFG